MLPSVDLSLSLDEKEYGAALGKYQGALKSLATQVYKQQRPVAILFEGWEADGAGGVIRRITEGIDPRGYVVYAITKPEGDEATHHYLWRFWQRLPEQGQIAIFDRSWYGRVLVERVEGFCTGDEWKRAYREINQFERQLVDYGTILFKFWLHISPDEQLRRFQFRASERPQNLKQTEEDRRNQEKWDDYEGAVSELLQKTSTQAAPWTVVEANSKPYARIKVLKTLVERLESELHYDPFVQPASAQKKVKKKKEKQKEKN